MKRKLIFALLILIVGAVGILISRRSVRSNQDPPEPYTLRWRAQQALGNGKTEIRQMLNPNYSTVTDLDNALASYSLIVIQPTDLAAVENDGSVATWYRVRVLEQLTVRPICGECRPLPDPPSSFGALAADELAVLRLSGSINVDGVNISTEEPEFPGFLLTQRYVLFVALDPSRKTATIPTGPVGAYLLDSNNVFVPLMANSNLVFNGLTTQYGNSLTQLKNGLGIAPSATPTPSPASCNPSQILIRRCEDNGGIWDFETCSCS